MFSCTPCSEQECKKERCNSVDKFLCTSGDAINGCNFSYSCNKNGPMAGCDCNDGYKRKDGSRTYNGECVQL